MGAPSGLVPAAVDLVARRNGDLSRTFVFSTDPVTPFDLTGWTATLQVRNAPNETGAALISLSSAGSPTAGGSRLVVYPPSGLIELDLSQPDLSNLPGATSPLSKSFYYDLVLALGTYSAPVVSGVLQVDPGVTI